MLVAVSLATLVMRGVHTDIEVLVAQSEPAIGPISIYESHLGGRGNNIHFGRKLLRQFTQIVRLLEVVTLVAKHRITDKNKYETTQKLIC